MKTGVIVFAHGSRVEQANDAVRAVAAELARAGGLEHVRTAFLELGNPDLEGAVAQLAAEGVMRMVVVPYFLTLGLHMERDLPGLVASIAKKYSDLSISITPPMDGHPALVTVLLDRVRQSAKPNP